MTAPWYVYLILLRPGAIARNLERARARGFTEVPNLWQLSLAVVRMWHRLAFRSETIGTCKSGRRRKGWRAGLLANRLVRLPFLLAEGAVVPLDLTGLASPPERVIRHLLGAHHDEHQFLFDLEILELHDELAALHRAVKEVVDQDTARSRRLRDLTVYENYHENLLAAVERVMAGLPLADPDAARDPDLSLWACLRWCARQPSSPRQTLAAYLAGAFRLDSNLDQAL